MTVVYAYARIERGRQCWQLVIPRCPLCGRSHVHGGGELNGDPKPYLSSRVPHCAHAGKRDTDMYWLTTDAALQGQPVPESLYAEVA